MKVYRFEKTIPRIKERFTLGKNERLKSRKLIEQLFKSGKSFSNFPLRVLYLFTDDNETSLQSGFTTSTKNFKSAVERNHIKRLMREAYRLEKNALAGNLKHRNQSLSVFFIYAGKVIPKYKEIAETMASALKRLEKIADENGISNT